MIREAEAFTVMMKHFMLACYISASLIRIKCIDCMFALTLWDFLFWRVCYIELTQTIYIPETVSFITLGPKNLNYLGTCLDVFSTLRFLCSDRFRSLP